MVWQNTASFLPVNIADLEAEAGRRCISARVFEEVEDFAKAQESLGFLYRADESILSTLSLPIRAEALLRTGSLLRRFAGRSRVEDEQEKAKDYLLKALTLFQGLGDTEKTAETLIALAGSYWYVGGFVQGRQLLGDPVFAKCDLPHIQAGRLLMLAMVARGEYQFDEALRLLRQGMSYCGQLVRPAITCKYHGELGNALLMLGEQGGQPDYINQALFHYTVSSQEAEEAGNHRYAGFIANNLGFIFFRYKRFDEAFEQLRRARQIFEQVKDRSCIAQVDETCAQALNAQGRYGESVPLLKRSIQTFETTGESSMEADALLTLCAAYVGLGQADNAEQCASRAADVYSASDAPAGEGRAQLTLAEILASHATPKFDRLLQSFLRATKLLVLDKDIQVVERMNRVEKRVLELSSQTHIRKVPEAPQPVSEGALWDEGLTLDEAKAKVEEWYLARLVLEHGTLAAIAHELDLSIEGVRQKLANYPHLELLRKAMRDAKVIPLGTHRPSRRPIRLRLADYDDHLVTLGPCGGDSLGIEPCESLDVRELGVVEIEGIAYAGYFDGESATLHSRCEGYPDIPCTNKNVRVIGRVVGYWKKGEGRRKIRPLKVS